MIKIGKPHIVRKDNKVYLTTLIEDEHQKIKQEIYYATTHEYGDFLCDEVADAFVVGMLLPAARYKQDIIVEGFVSSKLFYNVNNTLSYILSKIWGADYRFNLRADIKEFEYESSAVGCGCSLGVDSFAAMLKHTSELCPADYRITHLTYFNVGAMGYVNLEKANESFQKDLKMVREFAKRLNLPVLCLESNFSCMYKDFDFDQSGDIRNFSAALSLQKLFKKYLYSSSFPVSDFKFERSQSGYYETLLAPLVSTSNCEIIIANPDMSRVDKTKSIVEDPNVKEFLYVCWKELIANKNPNSEIAKIKDNFLNCTRCDKCLRTILTIDILGKIDEFSKIFDVQYYLKHRDAYIAKVLYCKNATSFYRELYDLMKDEKYPISANARLRYILYEFKIIQLIYRIKNLLKK